jgi:hypothetical protein
VVPISNTTPLPLAVPLTRHLFGTLTTRASAVQAVAAPEKPALKVSGQDVGPKDAPLPSLFPAEPKPPAPVSN